MEGKYLKSNQIIQDRRDDFPNVYLYWIVLPQLVPII